VKTVALFVLMITLSGCTLLRMWNPHEPPADAKLYPGKTTHYVMKRTVIPIVLDIGFMRYSYWPTAPNFQTFALCLMGTGSRCLHFYGGIKVDGALTKEWRQNYGGAADEYVFEFKKEEQSAGGLHQLDGTCSWENMGRC
jgi:hypothetical protein